MLSCDLGTVGLIFGWFNELENSHFLIWKNEKKFPFSYLELIRGRDLKETMESMLQREEKKKQLKAEEKAKKFNLNEESLNVTINTEISGGSQGRNI